MSYWRSKRTHTKYQQNRATNPVVDLRDNPRIKEWEHWALVENNYPYDLVLHTHHMLIALRDDVQTRDDLNTDELHELGHILRDYLEPRYDMVFENMPPARTVLHQFHLHVASIKNLRDTKETP